LGLLSAAAVIDLTTDNVISVPLPDNSGATGVAFWNDSIAYVGNPNLNTVSRINVFSGVAGPEIDVGVYPQAIIASTFWVFVLNGELDANFQPARTGSITVIDPQADTVRTTISLSGSNPSAAALGPNGWIYVINSGTFGQGNGSLSVIEPILLTEVEHEPGFGEFPGDIAVDDGGFVYVSSFFYGIAVWNPAEGGFRHSPFEPLLLDGHSISSGVGFDSEGRLYSLIPGDCQAPSMALRSVDQTVEDIAVGVCPVGIVFTDAESQ
jgi:DNA-binding beta-propeller fold protein YncE